MAWLISLTLPHLDDRKGPGDILNCPPTLILTAMAWLISYNDPDRRDRVNILDCNPP